MKEGLIPGQEVEAIQHCKEVSNFTEATSSPERWKCTEETHGEGRKQKNRHHIEMETEQTSKHLTSNTR